MVKAYSGSKDFAAVVGAMQEAWCGLDIDPWVEYVRSDANLADDPSRGQLDAMRRMGAVEVSFRVPDLGRIAARCS